MLWLLENKEALSFAEPERFLPLLPEAPRVRILSMKHEPGQVQSLLAWLLLRHAYAQEYGGALPEVRAALYGKPEFTGQDMPQFNLSHCPLAIACALDGSPVGVDVQPLHRYDPKLRRVLSEPERVWVEEADSDARFTVLWTRKEAYGKAMGWGIGYDMTQTDFSGDSAEPLRCDGGLLRTVAREGYFLSACAREVLPLRTVSSDELFQNGEDTEYV